DRADGASPATALLARGARQPGRVRGSRRARARLHDAVGLTRPAITLTPRPAAGVHPAPGAPRRPNRTAARARRGIRARVRSDVLARRDPPTKRAPWCRPGSPAVPP